MENCYRNNSIIIYNPLIFNNSRGKIIYPCPTNDGYYPGSLNEFIKNFCEKAPQDSTDTELQIYCQSRKNLHTPYYSTPGQR